MPLEAILGIAAFGAMFLLWVVLPNRLHKRD